MIMFNAFWSLSTYVLFISQKLLNIFANISRNLLTRLLRISSLPEKRLEYVVNVDQKITELN